MNYKTMTNEEFDSLVSQECERIKCEQRAKIEIEKDTINISRLCKKSPSEIKKNDIIYLDNKLSKIIDISFTRRMTKYLFVATECDTNQKKEKIFFKDDIVYI